MRKEKPKQVWVHPNLAKELKIESAMSGKKICDVSKELADIMKEKRNKGKRENVFF